MANEIKVWLFRDQVGTLSLSQGRLGFQYSADWLKRPSPMAISQSLPLQPGIFEDNACRPFFAGLLPEGNLRKLVAHQCHVSSQNDFALLNAIGGECAGAITFLPPGRPLPSPEEASIEWLDEKQLLALLDELPRRPMLAGRDGMRLSLAGAQDKLPVVFDGQRIGLPKSGQPSTHILKPQIRAVQDSVINEAFCMSLANAMKFQVAQSLIFDAGDHRVLLVSRYDRAIDANGKLTRLHQEDFCQALGVLPEMKYQNEGGPDLKACFDLLFRATRPSAPEILRLLDAVVFNALIGNHDAHAKNFSLLYAPVTPTLAPLYDLLSTAVYDNLTPKMAMKLGGRYKFTEVQTRHWEQFAETAGMSVAQSKRRILRMSMDLPLVARKLQSAKSFESHPLVENICQLIEHRAALTQRRLS